MCALEYDAWYEEKGCNFAEEGGGGVVFVEFSSLELDIVMDTLRNIKLYFQQNLQQNIIQILPQWTISIMSFVLYS